jgi:hypothetical protein
MLFILKNSDALGSREAHRNSDEGAATLRQLIAQAQGDWTPNHDNELGLDEAALRAVQRIASERFQMSGASGSPQDSPSAYAPFVFSAFAPTTHDFGSAGSSTGASITPFSIMSADVLTPRFGASGTSQTTDPHLLAPVIDFAIWSDQFRLATHLLSGQRDGAPQLWQDMLDDIKRDPGLDMDPDQILALYLSAQDGWQDLSQVAASDGNAMLDGQDLFNAASAEQLGAFLLEYVREVLRRDMRHQDRLDWTSFQLNVDSALTSADIISRLRQPVQRAERALRLGELLDSKAHKDMSLCIFLDETNTSSCMGVFKELIVDQWLNGVDLPANVVIISAINPARHRLTNFSGANLRREELAKEWTTGHYQVHPLPLSIEMINWSFGALSPLQEKEFIHKRMQMLYPDFDEFPKSEQLQLANLIATSQELTRLFAAEHIAAMPSTASQAGAVRLSTDARRAAVGELRAVLMPMLPKHIT